MEYHRALLTLLAVSASIVPGMVEGRFLYHIPWACSIVYQNGDLICAGALLELRWLIVAASPFNNFIQPSDPPKRYLEDITEVYAYCGSNFMDYRALHPRQKSRYQREMKAERIHVPFRRPETNAGQWDIRENPLNLDEAEKDIYGLAFDVAFLVLNEPLSRSPYVLPMLVKGPDLAGRTTDFIRKLRGSPLSSNSCITYSYNQERRQIRYHEVMYQTDENCIEAYCNWKLSACNKFPTKPYLKCFKSVTYADACPNAVGAVLYCPDFNNSVFAVLTTAPSCGQRNIPGVYTTFPIIAQMYDAVLKEPFEPEKRVPYDLWTLPQLDSDYVGILP